MRKSNGKSVTKSEAPAPDDIKGLAAELDEMVKGQEPEQAEPSVVESLAAANAALADATSTLVRKGAPVQKAEDAQPEEHRKVRGGPDADDKGEDDEDEDDDGEDEEKSENAVARRAFYKSFADEIDGDEDTERLLDASPAMQQLASAIGKSMGQQATAHASLRAEITVLKGAIGVLLKSQMEMHKLLGGIQVKPASPGVVGTITKADGSATKLSRRDISDRVQKAVQDGKVEPKWLGYLDINGGFEQFVEAHDPDLLKSYGIPQP